MNETSTNAAHRASPRRVVAILGMHRSGTSALSGLLGTVGVELGDSMRAPHPGVNERGYWEHLDVVRLHDRMLSALGSSWDDPRSLPDGWWADERVRPYREELGAVIRRDFANADVWGVKDPRMCRLIAMWRGLFDEHGFRPAWILTLRHPVEVARSLERRDGFSLPKSGLLWLLHQLEAEWETRGPDRTFVRFDDILTDPVLTLERIETRTGLRYPSSVDESLPRIRAFIEPGLRHHRAADESPEIFGPWGDLIARTLAAWNRAAAEGEDEALRRELDGIRTELRERQRAFDASLASHIETLYARIGQAEREMNAIRTAPSWHLTKPLRLAERIAGRVSRGLRVTNRSGPEGSRPAVRETAPS